MSGERIKKARAILDQWRSGSMYEAILSGRTLVPIIDGTAGNPALLDALDELLAVHEVPAYMVPASVRGIAEAIITAQERMGA